jgi:hypothetical protein
MAQKSTLTLDKEFISYCELNDIADINSLAKKTFDRGFTILKYGETPKGNFEEVVVEKEIIKEVIKEVVVEKIVEVPVEVIKEVIKEVKVEVPVEVIKEVKVKGKSNTITKEIIKEVPVEIIVEKIVEVINDKEIEILKQENERLKNELDNITSSLSRFTKAKFMKNSDMSDLYGE